MSRALIFTGLVGAFATLAVMAAGCGGASAEVRTAYAVEQARCLANERAIIDRAGTSYDDDVEAMRVERARCDAALRAIYGGE